MTFRNAISLGKANVCFFLIIFYSVVFVATFVNKTIAEYRSMSHANRTVWSSQFVT